MNIFKTLIGFALRVSRTTFKGIQSHLEHLFVELAVNG